jgi:hypothetical protein
VFYFFISSFFIESFFMLSFDMASAHFERVVVNYTLDRAIRFDLDGNALEILPRAHRLAEAHIAIRDRPLPLETLQAVMPVK